jgi:hypothetical protein
MPVTAHDFAATIQRALPHAKVFWEKPPDFFLTEQPCALTAECIANTKIKFTMNMPHGLGQEPLDDVVQKFVDEFNIMCKK